MLVFTIKHDVVEVWRVYTVPYCISWQTDLMEKTVQTRILVGLFLENDGK